MARMRVSLKGLFANVTHDLPRQTRDYYRFSLDEFYQHLTETVEGKHTLAELAEHYCLTEPVTAESS